MATIGLDRLFYAKITEASDGEETYGVPAQLAKAMKAELSIELAEAVLYADDGAAEVIKDFKSGTLSLGVDDIGVAAARDLTGAVADDNGVSSPERKCGRAGGDWLPRAQPDGRYRYFWIYKVKFGIPPPTCKPKANPSPSPRLRSRVRCSAQQVDGLGKHPWKAEVTEGAAGVHRHGHGLVWSGLCAVYTVSGGE